MRSQAAHIAFLVSAAAGCTSNSQVASRFCASQVVLAVQGGTVNVAADECPTLAGASVAIGPNALGQDTLITIAAGPATIASAFATGVGPVVEFGPSGTHFSGQAIVTLPFDRSKVPEPYRLVVQAREAGGAGHRIEHADLNLGTAEGILSFQVANFTEFEVEVDGSPCSSRCPPTYLCDPDTGACACAAGQSTCSPGGMCIDLQQDEDCGACGNVCAGNSHCLPGVGDTPARCLCGGGTPDSCFDRNGGSLECVDLAHDPANCGSCGTVCPADHTCDRDGGAVAECMCREGTACPNAFGSSDCVDLSQDLWNCGTCGARCPSGFVCGTEGADAGAHCFCVATICKDPDGGALYCTDPSRDPNNCGACGNACAVGSSCGPAAGGGAQCLCQGIVCQAPDPGAAPFCTDPSQDLNNCGACGHACKNGFTCGPSTDGGGACGCLGTVCTDAEGGAYCADLIVNSRNCGACGNACDPGFDCSGAKCACQQYCATPDAGGSQCADLLHDPSNCGSCGNVCEGGACCPDDCGPVCVDLKSDERNCGGCGQGCNEDEGQYCVDGMCCLYDQTGCLDPDAGHKACTDERSDPRNCGTCGTDCGSRICISGNCI